MIPEREPERRPALVVGTCHGGYLNPPMSNDWRTSLVPAPAVIPASRAYIIAAAVKGFVVGIRAVGR